MENTKTQLLEKLQAATNILVTVSSNPSVDQLTACIGMTLWLNKIGKHATAVFSGEIPNALEFLQPEATIEKDTNSLRDFIIALDKSKADKLRYKVEDQVVKIFITPYRTSLSPKDLEYSQGDFNVDAIVAIGVSAQEDLDNAIMAHGRILHDAVVTTITTNKAGQLGSINWYEPTASSLSELVYEVCMILDATQIDPQIATALMTGIVAETSRFSNSKTSAQTMSMAAALMSAGANQQLVATKLEEANKPVQPEPALEESKEVPDEPKEEEAIIEAPPKPSDGSLKITHNEDDDQSEPKPEPDHDPTPENEEQEAQIVEEPTELPQPELPQPETTQPELPQTEAIVPPEESVVLSKRVTEPPSLGGRLNASDVPDDQIETSVNPLSLSPTEQQLLSRQPSEQTSQEEQEAEDNDSQEESSIPESTPTENVPSENVTESVPEEVSEVDLPIVHTQTVPSESQDSTKDQTLAEIENAVDSPHLEDIRDQVLEALKSGPLPEPEKRSDLNAAGNLEVNSPMDLQPQPTEAVDPLAFEASAFEVKDFDQEDKNDVPQVPPPIVPPDFLPPSPPAQ